MQYTHVCKGKLKFQKPSLILFTVAFFLVHIFFGAVIAVAKITVSATLDTHQFPLDKVAVLTIEVQGARSGNIHLPKVKNLRFHPRGESTQMQMINGNVSISTSSRYLIQAFAEGEYTIPPLTVSVSGQKHTTDPLTFTVSNSSSPPQNSSGRAEPQKGPDQGDEIAFLRIENMKDASYTGEVIPIKIKGYFRQGIKVQISSLPVLKGDGFVLLPLEEEPHQGVEVFNNTRYATISWTSAVSAIKEGKHPLSMEMEAALLFPQRSRSPFGNRFFQDDIFDDFFGSYNKKIVTLTSPDQKVKALPLPDRGKPKKFSGAIGDFSLEVSAEPTHVDLGDPITLTMAIGGQGNFDRVTAPYFPENTSWKTYSPSSEFLPGASKYQGIKKFEQAIVAKDGRITTIPSLTFTYFDPIQEKYITRSSKPIPISINKVYAGAAPMQQSLSTRKEVESSEPEKHIQSIAGLAPIHLHAGSFTRDVQPLFLRKWYLGIIGLCGVLLFSYFYIAMRKRHLVKNPQFLTKRKSEEQLVRNIESLKKLLHSDDSHEFLAGCRQTIQEQSGIVWGIEPSAITLDDLKRKLGADSSLLEIFAAAEQSAYGGLSLSKNNMKNYLEKLQQELGELQ